MHGTFPVRSGANQTPAQALKNGGTTSASTSAVGKTVKPSTDPRTQSYVDG